MFVKRVIIENIFNYGSKREFVFNKVKNKNIFLLIGNNGKGKTSFLNALKIGFVGLNKSTLTVNNKTLSKKEFINGNDFFQGLLHSGKKQGSILIETDTFFLKRTFNNKAEENIQLKIKKENQILKGFEALDTLTNFYSPNLIEYFLFDGEKINILSNFYDNSFKNMIKEVLNINFYETAISDLNSLKIKLLKKNQTQKEKLEYEKIEQDLEKTYQEITLKEEKRLNLLKEIEEKEIKLKEQNFEEYEKKLNKIKENILSNLFIFENLSFLSILNYLNPKLIEKMKKEIKNYLDLSSFDKNILEEKLEKFVSELVLYYNHIDQNFVKELGFNIFFEMEKNKKQNNYLNVKKIKENLSNFNSEYNVKKIIEKLQKLFEEKKQIEKSKKDEKEKYEILEEIISEIEKDKIILNQVERDLKELKIKQKNLEKRKKEIEKTLLKDEIDTEKLLLIEKSINSLTKIKANKIEKKLKIFNSIFKEKFFFLKKDDWLVKNIKINENFEIELYDENNNLIKITSLSAGQKQLIIISLIYSMNKFLNNIYPVVIDTPLGRLDDINQEILIRKFFPFCSEQVILLPTLSELDNKKEKILSPYIAKKDFI